jgi:hypothetical protein
MSAVPEPTSLGGTIVKRDVLGKFLAFGTLQVQHDDRPVEEHLVGIQFTRSLNPTATAATAWEVSLSLLGSRSSSSALPPPCSVLLSLPVPFSSALSPCFALLSLPALLSLSLLCFALSPCSSPLFLLPPFCSALLSLSLALLRSALLSPCSAVLFALPALLSLRDG